MVRLHSISQFPLSIAAYWIPESLLEVIHKTGTLLDFEAATKHGVQTTDDFQFMRLSWEVPNSCLAGKKTRWPTLAKGGEYSPFIDNLHLCVDWMSEGEKLRAYLAQKRLETQGSADWTPWMNSHEYYFQEGLTFPARTASDFSPRILPKGCVFTASGQALLFKEHMNALCYLAASFTRSFKLIVEAFVGSGDNSVSGSAANTYRTGLVNALPVPYRLDDQMLSKMGAKLVVLAGVYQKYDETSRHFSTGLSSDVVNTPIDILEQFAVKSIYSAVEALEILYEIDTRSQELFGIDEATIQSLFGAHPCEYSKRSISSDEFWVFKLSDEALIQAAIDKHGTKRQFTKKAYFFNRRFEMLCHVLEAHPKSVASVVITEKYFEPFWTGVYRSIASWFMGVAIGRWDQRVLTRNHDISIWEELGEFPVSNGDITGILEQTISEDIGISESARAVLFSIFGDIAQFKDLLSGLLGTKSLEEYFGKPNNFFAHHYSCYSESRRNAPIYWPLQTQSGSYTIWIYYHILNEQTLYTCVNDLVDPKLTYAEQNLNVLRGNSSRTSQEEKDLARLTDLVSELRDFRDELLRIAKFWKPNLNDGVQITAAPLWKLFQHKAWQKKLKETWESLEKARLRLGASGL